MNEILVFGVVIGGVFSAIGSAVLVHLGETIDRFPREGDEKRVRSVWSPREFTRYAVAIYWPLYLAGAVMLLPGTRLLTVAGIATIFGLVLFMVTALVFSVATYHLMQSGGRKESPRVGLFSSLLAGKPVSPYPRGRRSPGTGGKGTGSPDREAPRKGDERKDDT
ncbi:MAG: hypothetical protein QXL43_00610 [Methanolinea sp.]